MSGSNLDSFKYPWLGDASPSSFTLHGQSTKDVDHSQTITDIWKYPSDTQTELMEQSASRGGYEPFPRSPTSEVNRLRAKLTGWSDFPGSTNGGPENTLEYYSKTLLGASLAIAGTLGGIAGGAAQAYLTMGMTTCMKTIDVTRPKNLQPGVRVPGTIEIFIGILRKEGIRGVNRGVNAVALRQISGWASRIGIARFAQCQIRAMHSKPAEAKRSV
ncbi:hypothetical protein LCI18_014810 [Fusarium solani-melongenae]|uniref:Uncharacterized protein n=1 Tax=Fusarium solani subsp. cucurbitae TaxID=2747967 RepID=A0ACD3ZRM2_FUSSC|nr:hypothetical protein LCI18_014810 [Fusarium solani-melongenae]